MRTINMRCDAIFRSAAVVLAGFISIGCCPQRAPQQINNDTLRRLVDSSEEDNVSSWLYLGTDERFSYFDRMFRAVGIFDCRQSYFAGGETVIEQHWKSAPVPFGFPTGRPKKKPEAKP